MDRHVVGFSWSPDSKQLLYRLTESSSFEATLLGKTQFQRILILEAKAETIDIKTSASALGDYPVWLKDSVILMRDIYSEGRPSSGLAVCRLSTDQNSVVYSGDIDNVSSMADIGTGT